MSVNPKTKYMEDYIYDFSCVRLSRGLAGQFPSELEMISHLLVLLPSTNSKDDMI